MFKTLHTLNFMEDSFLFSELAMSMPSKDNNIVTSEWLDKKELHTM